MKGEVTIEFGLRFRGDLAMVPMSQWIGLFVCAIASLCVCVFPCINTGTGDFTEQIFPLCFHSELGEIDD